ncbi:acyl-CoA dehydrogenase family protein [Nocardioides sp. B-3]|uniref:acyl-CoA dehydrogenase family protein n=1 Tax=Nocardioides sp. B-3 TaxID=2895565 RepID=UPI002152BCB1|nr:acyl-CoA dehydrogenase family protein [Nocardioides sp. B-3]UUZ59245.1 acyl-CoA/acyl-ACP dehydrogenase [Nocardioides sp. B-3]
MDFDFSTEADEAAELAATILKDLATPERMRAVEADGDRFDHDLWRSLGDAGLLGLAVPESYGGAGLGLVEALRVIVEVGRTVAPVPVAPHVACALALAEHGTDAQRSLWLSGAASRDRVLAAAVSEDTEALPARPSTTATRSDDGWVLNGTKTPVRAGHRADLLLVTASTPDGVGVFVVEASARGATTERQRTTDGDVALRITFDDVALPAHAHLGDGAASRLADLLTVTGCAEQLGVTEGALALTAAYAKVREQFGRPIATFRAVSQRLADGYIDTLGQRLTLWQAARRLGEGRPAEKELATAALFAADAGHRVAHTAVHVHGGVGIDLDGETHRYFTAAKRWEYALSGTTQSALAIGRSLAAEPV